MPVNTAYTEELKIETYTQSHSTLKIENNKLYFTQEMYIRMCCLFHKVYINYNKNMKPLNNIRIMDTKITYEETTASVLKLSFLLF